MIKLRLCKKQQPFNTGLKGFIKNQKMLRPSHGREGVED